MHIQSVLEQLGLSESQVKIYLVSLKLGEAKVAEIGKQAGIARTTTAELLEEMHKQGLINYYIKRGHKYWLPEDPQKLMAGLKEKELGLAAILPQLVAMRRKGAVQKPGIKFYSGKEEIKFILDDIITTKHHILGLVSEDDFRQEMGADYMDDFIERRKNHFLKIKFIGPRSARTQLLKTRDANELRHTRFLPDEVELNAVSNFIYGDKTAIISLNQKQSAGIVIDDANVARAMSVYFESLWHHCSDT